MDLDFDGGDEIRFERVGSAAIVTLTRPKALNAITHRMIKALHAALIAWEKDATVSAVVVKAEGRAFSAGGDILDVYKSRDTGNPPVGFFADEYRLNAYIDSYPKPYVALIDGIVMGGGVGISFHGSHRVLTENAVFAMPEVGIGFFPDVGASHVLPDLGGWFGMYLALTGNRIRYGDALWSGLATHTTKAKNLVGIVQRIGETGNPGHALRECFVMARRETDHETLEAISRHFGQETLAGVIRGLEADATASEFAHKTLDTILSRSPTSLRVAFRQIRAGLTLSMADCMKMEFRILNRMLAGHDFYEGIRAALVDKDQKPQWRPSKLDSVHGADIDAYFAPLPDGDLAL